MSNNFWKTLYAIDRRVLYLILIVLVSWQIVKPIQAENVVSPMTKSFYTHLSELQPNDLVIIESDWTTSTRGESLGQFQALMRLLMRKQVRFVITCVSDPLIPDLLRPIIGSISEEHGGTYRENENWFMAGYFPGAEAHIRGMVNDLRKELAPKGILDTQVLAGIDDISDAKAVVVVTGSASINLWYERIRNKAPVGLMCTAVMSAENIPYFVSGQLFGIVIGAKGAYDMETLLAEEFPSPEYKNYQSGLKYMSPLAFALGLLILSVVLGNIAMFVLRRRGEL